MKKYLKIFVLILVLSTARIKWVKAESFYEDNWVAGVYANLIDGDFSKPQHMRFIRRSSDNKAVYCLTPRLLLYDDQIYTRHDIFEPLNIPESKLKKINKIAYFGYGYQDHVDDKWYAITQIMIWKEVEPNMDIFFTDGYKGNRITRFENEMQEINNLIAEYEKFPRIFGMDLVADREYEFIDKNNAIKNYNLYSDDGIEVSMNNDALKINTKSKGNYRITFYKNDDLYYDNPYVYTASQGQDIFIQGTIGGLSHSFNVNVTNNKLQITKQDIDTLEYIDGVKFNVYDENYEYVGEITTDENGVGIIDHLENKLYRIKEHKVSEKYQIDDSYHEIYINDENNYMTLYNEKIKANVILNKYTSDDSILQPEENAEFEIYDEKDNLVSTIKTNNNGVANIILSYGKYRMHQSLSKEGYKKVKDFNVVITNSEDIIYYLKNEKIIEIKPNKEESENKEDPKEDIPKQDENKSEKEIKKKEEIEVENKKDNIENPKTGDYMVYIYIVIGYIAFMMIMYIISLIKKK